MPDRNYSKQRLVLGTHTSDNEQNYLMIAEVQLPLEDGEVAAAQGYAAERGEAGGFGGAHGKVHVVQQINHDGEVNRARVMPQEKFLIATKTVSAEVFVFDYSKHPSKPNADGVCAPDLRLLGHKTEGYGLAWSPFKPGRLLSSSDDAQICTWDVCGTTKERRTLDALATYSHHAGVIEDCAWHAHHPDVFGSVGDDRRLALWDARRPPTSAVMVAAEVHAAEVNCLAFNPHNPHVLATGSADKTVALHDWRNLAQRLHVLEAHTEEVFQVGWSPRHETVLSSCGADRRVMLWDLSRIGDEQAPEDAEDGPPELLFVHGGHTSKVSDLAWNGSDDWVMASVAEDNILQVWQMSEALAYGGAGLGGEPNDAVGGGGV